MGIFDLGIKPGVIVGDDVSKVFQYAKKNHFAIPAVNCTTSSSVNAALEAARDVNSPIIIQFSQGGAAFYAGKGIDNKDQKASILGAVAGAKHAHAVAKAYGVVCILHSDHCSKKLLPWLYGMIEEGEAYYKQTGSPLFSSHMVDMSEQPHPENVEESKKLLARLSKMGMTLEMEIGITGGEEDGVDNSNVDKDKLYTQPEDIDFVYTSLLPISPKFTVAAAFGNVHGVYKPGNVHLRPEILGKCQQYLREKHSLEEENPCTFVFHGGSGSAKSDIEEALRHGVVKFNIDTDTQWSYWSGILDYYKKKEDCLQGQIGNSSDPDAPNKKNYDPRVWIREAEKSMSLRLQRAFEELNCMNRN